MGGRRVQLIDYAVVRGKAIDSVEPRDKNSLGNAFGSCTPGCDCSSSCVVMLGESENCVRPLEELRRRVSFVVVVVLAIGKSSLAVESEGKPIKKGHVILHPYNRGFHPREYKRLKSTHTYITTGALLPAAASSVTTVLLAVTGETSDCSLLATCSVVGKMKYFCTER